MPKARNPENQGLPPRWKVSRGAYYYQVPPGQKDRWDGKVTFKLGDTLAEAYQVYGERIGGQKEARTVGELLDRYMLEVVPKKAVRTQVENRNSITRLRPVFGAMEIGDIRPQMVYKYHSRSKSKAQARKDRRTLSHAYTKAVEWGLIDVHPLIGQVRIENEKPRDRYVEDWELDECLGLKSKRAKGSVRVIQAYIVIKLLTALRKSDLLRIDKSTMREDGIHVTPRKTINSTGKRLVILWTPALRLAVDVALEARPNQNSEYLFCNRRGEGYFHPVKQTASGWDSMWQRFMDRVLSETKMTERFTEHDIRAKSGSDLDTIEEAQRLLGHSDPKVTARHYRRKAERIKPLR